MSYGNCSCIADFNGVGITDEKATATNGRCKTNCTNIKILAPCLFLALLAVLLGATPTSIATLRYAI